jgi:hypothetical protein
MKRNLYFLIIFCLTLNLLSSEKIDTNVNRLIGTWQSTKVDSLIRYIDSTRDSVFHSVNFKNNILELNSNGSFQLTRAKDTIYGSWIQSKKDSVMLTNNNKRGERLHESRIEFIDNDNLTMSYNYVKLKPYRINETFYFNAQSTVDIKIYYKKK